MPLITEHQYNSLQKFTGLTFFPQLNTFSSFPVNDISSLLTVYLCLSMWSDTSLHQYSLRTNNWHISTKYSVIWRRDRCVMVCYYWLCKHSIHVSFSAVRQKERAKPLYTMLLGCMHTSLSVAFRTTQAHTLHISRLSPSNRFRCFDFCMCVCHSVDRTVYPSLLPLTKYSMCTFETHANVSPSHRSQLHSNTVIIKHLNLTLLIFR